MSASFGGYFNRINTILTAAGCNFQLLLRWFAAIWRAFIQALFIGAAIAAAR